MPLKDAYLGLDGNYLSFLKDNSLCESAQDLLYIVVGTNQMC